MDIFGYIGFVVLIFLAVTWTIGIRVKLDTGVPTIIGGLFFLVAAIILGVSGANKLHSLWIIPAGFIFALVAAFLPVHIPSLFALLQLIASLFASVVRVGIPAQRVRAAQDAGLRASLERWASKHHKEK